MKIKNEKLYQEYQIKYISYYSQAIMSYGELWALYMEREIAKGFSVADCAKETSDRADTEGITGNMYNGAVAFLTDTWKYGEELRVWHNAKYNHAGEGVVNSAIIKMKL